MDDDIDRYSLSDSETELTEKERKILAKVRKAREEENFDSDDEVLGFGSAVEDEDEEEEEEMEEGDDGHDSLESDIEGLEDGYEMPDEKAWGKKRKTYYSTDYVDPDYSSLSEKQKAIAKMEEEEARKIQKRLADQLDDADFGLDMIVGKKEAETEIEKDVVEVDLSKLSSRQKLQLLEKESPEFVLLLNDFQDRLEETKEIIKPFLDLVKSEGCEETPAVVFLKSKYQLLRKYFVNLTFYMMMKAKRLPTTSHPVIKRLAENRYWLAQFDEKQQPLFEQIKSVLTAYNEGQPIFNSITKMEISKQSNPQIQSEEDVPVEETKMKKVKKVKLQKKKTKVKG